MCMQTSMSGISITEDAVNLFYLMKAKSTVSRFLWSPSRVVFIATLQPRWRLHVWWAMLICFVPCMAMLLCGKPGSCPLL